MLGVIQLPASDMFAGTNELSSYRQLQQANNMLLYAIIYAFCFGSYTKHPTLNGIVSVTLAALYKFYFTYRCLKQHEWLINLWYSILVLAMFTVNWVAANSRKIPEEDPLDLNKSLPCEKYR